MTYTKMFLHLLLLIAIVFIGLEVVATEAFTFNARSRVETSDGSGQFKPVHETRKYDPARTAVVVVDMWDNHHCISAAERTAEMAPHLNRVVNAARDQGMFIIHAPSDTMDFYRDTPQRKRAQEAPHEEAPASFQWNNHNSDHEGPLSPELAGEYCSCDTPEPCGGEGKLQGSGGEGWTRQIATIEIAPEDAISDDGQEIYNLLAQRGIDDVIIMGVHTNACVLGRPFGIRQMVYNRKKVILCRDLTDSFHRDPGKHFQGLDRIIEHIEKYWCPTITSTAFTGRPAFRFKADTRPRVAFVIAEDEYEAARTLPEFAKELETKYSLACTVLLGGDNDIPGLETLIDADLVVLYVRRKVLPAEQMNYLRDYVKSGRPLVGLRTASHAFYLREEEPPTGLEEWPEFDRDVLGGNYHDHHGNDPETGPFTYVWINPGMESHPVLAGVPTSEFRVPSWLYKTSPLAETATALMMGRVGDRKPHEPVAWTNTNLNGGRVFYTSLGHPDDFGIPAFRRLLLNGISFALGRPLVPEGTISDEQLVAIKNYRFGDSRRTLTYVEDLVLQTDDSGRREDLARLLGTLLGDDTTFECKQFVCQQLSIIGTEEQVPALAKLLTDEKLSDVARFGLERIPSEKAVKALRDALGQASGTVRVGIINSLGRREDDGSTKVLGKLLSDSDDQTAEAAAIALGMIGSTKAASQLKSELRQAAGERREILANAYLSCADNLLKEGDESAAAIYTEMNSATESQHVRMMAWSGLVSLRSDASVSLITEALRGDDTALRIMALRYVRKLPGRDVTKEFSNLLPKLPQTQQVLLLNALADRGDAAALPTVVKAAGSSDGSVRMAALKVLGRLGNAQAVGLLTQRAANSEGDEREAARQSLYQLRGREVNAAIMSLMNEEESTGIRLEAIQGLSARGATEAVKILLQTVGDTDQRIRLASWGAFGALGDEVNLPALVSLWLRTQSDEELRAAEDAVVAVARNVSIDDRPAAAVLAVVDSVDDVRVKSSLLQALGRIGDEGGLGTLRAGLKDNDSRIETAAVRALASWPTDEPMSDLKTIAQEADSDTHRILALRGYIRMLDLDGDRPEKETAKMYGQALLLAERAEEKKLILAGLANVVHVEALRIVEPYLGEAEVRSEAAAAAARIGAEVDEREQIEDEAARQYVKAMMDKVISVSQDETAIEMAQKVIENINAP